MIVSLMWMDKQMKRWKSERVEGSDRKKYQIYTAIREEEEEEKNDATTVSNEQKKKS